MGTLLCKGEQHRAKMVKIITFGGVPVQTANKHFPVVFIVKHLPTVVVSYRQKSIEGQLGDRAQKGNGFDIPSSRCANGLGMTTLMVMSAKVG